MNRKRDYPGFFESVALHVDRCELRRLRDRSRLRQNVSLQMQRDIPLLRDGGQSQALASQDIFKAFLFLFDVEPFFVALEEFLLFQLCE